MAARCGGAESAGGSVSSFSIASFNVLADAYARRSVFPYCPAPFLRWPSRSLKLRELLFDRFDCDIFCLQEVDKLPWWRRELTSHGYDFMYAKRGKGANRQADGCLIAWRRDRFRVVQVPSISGNAGPAAAEDTEEADCPTTELLQGEIDLNEIADIPSVSDNQRRRFSQHNVAAYVVLEQFAHKERAACGGESSKPDTLPSVEEKKKRAGADYWTGMNESWVLVANVHVFWNPLFEDVKLRQCMYLTQRLADILDGVVDRAPAHCRPGGHRPCIPVVLCGDFNSLPCTQPYRFMSRGVIDAQLSLELARSASCRVLLDSTLEGLAPVLRSLGIDACIFSMPVAQVASGPLSSSTENKKQTKGAGDITVGGEQVNLPQELKRQAQGPLGVLAATNSFSALAVDDGSGDQDGFNVVRKKRRNRGGKRSQQYVIELCNAGRSKGRTILTRDKNLFRDIARKPAHLLVGDGASSSSLSSIPSDNHGVSNACRCLREILNHFGKDVLQKDGSFRTPRCLGCNGVLERVESQGGAVKSGADSKEMRETTRKFPDEVLSNAANYKLYRCIECSNPYWHQVDMQLAGVRFPALWCTVEASFFSERRREGDSDICSSRSIPAATEHGGRSDVPLPEKEIADGVVLSSSSSVRCVPRYERLAEQRGIAVPVRSVYSRYRAIRNGDLEGMLAGDGEPEFTNFKGNFNGCLDYIFYSHFAPPVCDVEVQGSVPFDDAQAMALPHGKRKLVLVPSGLSEVPTVSQASKYGGLPSKAWPSDHIILSCMFSRRWIVSP